MVTTTYRAYNTKTGRWYVGSTTQGLKARKPQHLKDLSNDWFHNSLRKNPEDREWEVLSEVEGLDRSHEQEILDIWVWSEFCLNIGRLADGGNGWDHVNSIKDENGRPVYALLASKVGNKKVHETLLEDGRSSHAVNMGTLGGKSTHREKNEEGKSVKGVEFGKIRARASHESLDKWGRSVNATKNGSEKVGYVVTDEISGEVLYSFPSSHVAAKYLNMTAKKVRYWAKKKKPIDGFLITLTKTL